MTYLKKPYAPTVTVSASKSFTVYGKSFMGLQAVYLSGSPYENQTFYNPFSAIPKLSATYPGFYGIKLSQKEYSTDFEKVITFVMPSATKLGYVDIIAQNPAGYGLLTQCAVKDVYSGKQTLEQLRPWALGIKVATDAIAPDEQIYTIDGEILVTILGTEYIVNIDQQPTPPITETYYIISNTGDTLVTNTNDKIVYGS